MPKIITALSLWIALTLAATAQPVISEFQASNNDTTRDEDGDTADWVEIFNTGASPFDLTGCSLSRDPAKVLRWTFPAVTLAPQQSLVVWASGKNRTVTGQPLHTDFVLSASGGSLALIAANGSTVLSDFPNYPAQPPDRSYGFGFPSTIETLVTITTAGRWQVPAVAIPNWQNWDFDDSTGWNASLGGIGYDRVTTSGINYLPEIPAGGNVEIPMYNISTSCYFRLPFSLTNPGEVTALRLKMKWEDGFAAWINGVRISPPTSTETNSPANPNEAAVATAVRADSSAVISQLFDLTGQKSVLRSGQNVLALQALNATLGSSDLLCVPELEVTKVNLAAPTIGFFATPTPGSMNTAATVLGFVDAPDFSVKRGIFSTPQTVTLTTNTVGASVRYTLDGSNPTATTGVGYTEPVAISSSKVLRAAAFLSGWQSSTTKSHTYIFPAQVKTQSSTQAGFPTTWGYQFNYNTGAVDPAFPVTADYGMDSVITNNATYAPLLEPALSTTLPIVSLSTATDNLFALNGNYANGRVAPMEDPASIEFFTPDGLQSFQEDMGLRVHGGNAPIDHPKKPFRVYFRKQYGVGKLKFPLYPGSPVDSFDTLQLRPGGHDGWSVPFGSDTEDLARHATYCRDRFLRQTELDMGRLSLRSRYVHVYINGLYWGVYDLHEVPNKDFFADHLGGLETDWDVYEHSNTSNPLFVTVDGAGDRMTALLALVANPASFSSESVYQQALQYIDPVEFIDHLIVQMWAGQNDWMGPVFRGTGTTNASRFFNKNWESGVRSRGTAGLFRWMVWDAEISMGSSLTNLVTTLRVTDFDHTRVGTPSTITGITGTPGPPAQIYHAMRQNATFRRLFADRLQKHFFNDGKMTVANNQARLQSLQDTLTLPIVAESARWGDVNSGNPVVISFNRDDHWLSEINWMKGTYMTGRNQTLLSQFQSIGIWPSVSAPALAQHGGVVPSGFALGMTAPLGATIYYTLDGSDPALTATSQEVVLTGPTNACKYKVPSANYISNSWKNLTNPSDIATWVDAPTTALGFDTKASPTYLGEITSTVANMNGVRCSLYTRIPFSVTPAQKAIMTSLTLRLKYDDGAFVWLNGGSPLHRLNAPTTTPAFTDCATANRAAADAVQYQQLSLTANINSLITNESGGTNLLAIQGLNNLAADGDFLLKPELVAGLNTPGGPSLTALSYSGPVSLSQTGTVKARAFLNGQWSAMTEARFVVGSPASAANLTISEFSYNPQRTAAEQTAGYTDQDFEFVEILNISNDFVELAGCRFDDGITFDFADSTVQRLSPGQRLVLASNKTALQFRHPGLSIAGEFAADSNLSNNGERIELRALNGSAIADFSYQTAAPWPAGPDGSGYSLVLINPLTDPILSNPANWRASISANGLPGLADADTFAAWAGRNGIPVDPLADTNLNGLSNLVDYALGSSTTPQVITGQFETLDAGNGPEGYFVVRFRKYLGADDAVIVPQISPDMTNWSPLTELVAAEETPAPDGTVEVTYRSAQTVNDGTRQYFRVEVTPRTP